MSLLHVNPVWRNDILIHYRPRVARLAQSAFLTKPLWQNALTFRTHNAVASLAQRGITGTKPYPSASLVLGVA